MSELMEPIKVERRATWQVGAYWRVVREESTGTVSVHGQSGTRLQVSSEVALQLSAAISAAAQWTDEPPVTCRPGCRPECTCAPVAARIIDGDVVHELVYRACPTWMATHAALELAERVIVQLAGVDGVTVLRGPDAAPWTPDTTADTTGGEIR